MPTGAQAHAGERHAGADASATDAPVLAPGYGDLGFTPPAPGSYALPPLGAAADGAVLDADGHATTLHEVFGDRVVLLSFVYASCSDVNGCPLATSVLHRVQNRIAKDPELAARVRLVSLSFDPERDTPEAMRKYAAGFDDGEVDWRFLTTASEARLQPILDAYGQSLSEELTANGEASGRIAHILRVFLIDPEQRIRNVYTVSFLHPDTLANDLASVIAGRAPAPPRTPPSLLRSGDVRAGYDQRDYRSDSTSLAARHGRAADLVARAQRGALGLPPIPLPEGDALTQARVELGRRLFFDRRLSRNGTISCAICHIPEQGFGNNEIATAVGIEGRSVRRNAPTLFDVAHAKRLFHDGRSASLEDQAFGPLLARNEMDNASAAALVARLASTEDYAARFEVAYPGSGLTEKNLGRALASYQRTLTTGDSAFDRWYFGGDEAAVTAAARRGFELFRGRAGCVTCHQIARDFALFTDGDFHNTGVGTAVAVTPPTRRVQIAPGQFVEVPAEIISAVAEPVALDEGRFEVSRDPADRGRFRTPTLRNVALTSPYMHDGSLRSLRDVVDFYARGGIPNAGLDPRIRPLELSEEDASDLVAFLETLTGGDVETLVRDALAAPIGGAN